MSQKYLVSSCVRATADPSPTSMGSQLAGFGDGWAEPNGDFHDLDPCRDANVLVRRECERWPVAEETRELAFEFGAMIENAWGSGFADSSLGSAPQLESSRGGRSTGEGVMLPNGFRLRSVLLSSPP